MNKAYAIALTVATVAAAAAAAHLYGAISFKGLQSSNAGTLMLGALFTALIIERAVEIVANNRFAGKEFKAKRDINDSQMAVTIAEDALKHETALRLADTNSPSSVALVTQKADALTTLRESLHTKRANLNTEKTNARSKLEDISLEKQSFAATLATVLGILAAVAGVRILGQFIEGETAKQFAADSLQLHLFYFADIILTALLLAGGADGIHKLTKDFYGKRKDILAPQTG